MKKERNLTKKYMNSSREFYTKFKNNIKIERNLKILNDYNSNGKLPYKVYKALKEILNDVEKINESNIKLKNQIEKMKQLS